MPTVDVIDAAGSPSGSADLPVEIFGREPNVPLMHQVVTAQLAARRAGTQNTKTRAEVAGGGAKPWRQKGTGRARAGTIRAPHWRGGGVALGPKPRSYAQRTPKKMIRAALLSALSDRAAEDKVVVVDAWDFEAPSTKSAVAFIEAAGLEGRILVVVGDDDEAVVKSFRNLTRVHLCHERELNAYDVLVSDVVVFSKATLPGASGTGNAAQAPAGAAEGVTPGSAKPAEAEPEQSETAAQPPGGAAGDDDSRIGEAGRAEGGDAAQPPGGAAGDDDSRIGEAGRAEGGDAAQPPGGAAGDDDSRIGEAGRAEGEA